MDNSLLAVRDINHRYIVVEGTKASDQWEDHDPRAAAEGNPAAGIAIDRIIGRCFHDNESVRYPEQTEG